MKIDLRSSGLSTIDRRMIYSADRLQHLGLLIIQHFRGFHGQATLYKSVSNVTQGEPEESEMTTGKNKTRKLYCGGCSEYLGWTYIGVPTPDQEYKLGKSLLETTLLVQLPSPA